MLVANSVLRDPRVTKEAHTLIDAGHDVLIAGLSESGNFTNKTNHDMTIKFKLFSSKPLETLRHLCSITGKNTSSESANSQQKYPKKHLFRNTARSLAALSQMIIINYVFKRAFKDLAPFAPEIIHAHDLNTLNAAAYMARKARARLIYDAHEVWPELGSYSQWYRLLLRRMERYLIRSSVDQVITVSSSIAKLMTKRYGISEPIIVMNAPAVKPIPPGALRKGPATITFIYQGSLTPGRGIEIFVQAFKYVTCRSRLIIRGFGPLLQPLKRLIDDEGLQSRVLVLPPVRPEEVVEKAAEDADIGIIPFLPININNELALPNKLFEYLYAGLAVFSVDLVEVRNIITKYDLGGVYIPTSPLDIARQVDNFLASSDIRRHQANAFSASRSDLNWSHSAGRLVSIYE